MPLPQGCRTLWRLAAARPWHASGRPAGLGSRSIPWQPYVLPHRTHSPNRSPYPTRPPKTSDWRRLNSDARQNKRNMISEDMNNNVTSIWISIKAHEYWIETNINEPLQSLVFKSWISRTLSWSRHSIWDVDLLINVGFRQRNHSTVIG